MSTRKYFFSSRKKKEKIGDDGKISDGQISLKDYLTCEKIWDKFEMKNMGDYHNHYLKKNVLFFTDVFEKFINICLRHYGLDPCRYFSSLVLHKVKDFLLEEVLKTCLEDVLKIFWRQTKYLLGISVYLSGNNKSKSVSSKSIFHKFISNNPKANPKCIN